MDKSLRPGPEHVILVAAEGATWLLQGEDHAMAMLSGEGDFPKPVFCVAFDSRQALARFLAPHDTDVLDLWEINPNVIERLQIEGILNTIAPPQER